MGSSILITDIPQELLQKIALYATLGSLLGPPKELYNLLLTCRLFRDALSFQNASELYAFVFAQKFDARAPSLRLGAATVREQAPLEMRRRFEFIRIFRQRKIHHPDLTQALWTAYTMVEDSDTSQKNMKQLLRAGMVDFLDLYLRERLYEGATESNDGWPVLNEQNSLAIALSWTLSSQSSVNREDRTTSDSMRDLLRPIVFAAFRYSIFPMTEDAFGFGGTFEPAQVPTVMKTAAAMSVASPISESSQIEFSSSIATTAQNQKPFPLSVLAPCDVAYFGDITLKARLPPAALFASLLYFTRMESITPFSVPPHISCATRAEAQVCGYNGVCLEDYEHFYRNCRTKFADFPALDVGVQSAAMAKEEGPIFQPVPYQLGMLSGRWQGSQLMPFVQEYKSWTENPSLPKKFDAECRSPLYLTIEEHYCDDIRAAVPHDDPTNGMKNAWLPHNLQATVRDGRMEFSDVEGTFHTTYKTYTRGSASAGGRDPQRQVVDVIITGKTDDQYARWGGGTVILGRVRMQDGLMVLVKSLPDNPDEGAMRTLLRGYVTSSQNLVGRVKGSWTSSESYYEGVFSLGKDHNTSRPYH